ncbi:hypothetical protein [Planococcus antarcticus]|nr:hypothetical protein [Planococcus antarcticus]
MEQLWNRYQQKYSYATDVDRRAIEKAVLWLWEVGYYIRMKKFRYLALGGCTAFFPDISSVV